MRKKIIQVASQLLQDGYAIKLCIKGSSMAPAILKKEFVIVKPFDKNSEIIPGEIVLRKRTEETFLAHRVILVQANQIITKGDSFNKADSPCFAEDVQGIVAPAPFPFPALTLHFFRRTIYLVRRAISRTFKRRHSFAR